MRSNLVVIGETNSDCGPACLLSIIRYFKGNLDLEYLRVITNTNKFGTTAYDIIKACEIIGLYSYALKIDFISLTKTNNLPLIAHVKKSNMYHFVVIYKILNNKIVIMDPSVGKVIMSYKEFENIYMGVVIFINKIKELPKIKTSNLLIKIIIKDITKYKYLLIILSTLLLITFLISLFDSLYYKVIIDLEVENVNIYYKYLSLFTFFILLKNLLIYIKNKLSLYINRKIKSDLENEITENLFCLPYCYYKNKPITLVVNKINELNSISNICTNLLINTSLEIILILISIIFLFFISRTLSIISIFNILVYFIICIIYNNRIITSYRKQEEDKAEFNFKLKEALDSLETIRNLNIKTNIKKILNTKYRNFTMKENKLNNLLISQHNLKNLISDLSNIVFLTIGAILVYKKSMSLGSFMLLYMINSFLITNMCELIDKYTEIKLALANTKYFDSIIMNKEIEEKSYLLDGDITISNLKFLYDNKNKIIDNLNLTIKRKDKILLTGKSGCGKSTLIKLILKYVEDYEGNITIDNYDLKDINSASINNSFVYIGQNEKLFNTTFKENIMLYRNVNDEVYEKVINICKLNEVRNNKILKDNDVIESDGFNYSGGEKQRIILARSLIGEFNYLIIDEALSEVSLDMEIEIINNIINNYKDKTIIYVSHKDKVRSEFKKVFNLERRIYE